MHFFIHPCPLGSECPHNLAHAMKVMAVIRLQVVTPNDKVWYWNLKTFWTTKPAAGDANPILGMCKLYGNRQESLIVFHVLLLQCVVE